MNIPENIIDKIMLYNSHPVADMIKNVFDEYSFDFEDGDTLYGRFYLRRKQMKCNLEVLDDDKCFIAELFDCDDDGVGIGLCCRLWFL